MTQTRIILSLSKILKQLFFTVCLIGAGLSVLSAQEEVMLEGRVINDSIDESYLHILNLSLQKGTITRDGGFFTIPVRVNDTLYISAVQFKHRQVIITPQIFSRKRLILELEQEVSELDEVNISNIELSGRLGEDFKIPKVEKPFDPAAVGLPVYTGPILTDEERRLFTATHSGSGLVSVDMLINAISGRTKMLEKHVMVSNMERRIQSARNQLPDSFYISELNIPEIYIDDFVHYVYENNETALAAAKRNEPLALIELLKMKAPVYRLFKGWAE